jgi:hypothetical protein
MSLLIAEFDILYISVDNYPKYSFLRTVPIFKKRKFVGELHFLQRFNVLIFPCHNLGKSVKRVESSLIKGHFHL